MTIKDAKSHALLVHGGESDKLNRAILALEAESHEVKIKQIEQEAAKLLHMMQNSATWQNGMRLCAMANLGIRLGCAPHVIEKSENGDKKVPGKEVTWFCGSGLTKSFIPVDVSDTDIANLVAVPRIPLDVSVKYIARTLQEVVASYKRKPNLVPDETVTDFLLRKLEEIADNVIDK
jgi:hypothetical protein